MNKDLVHRLKKGDKLVLARNHGNFMERYAGDRIKLGDILYFASAYGTGTERIYASIKENSSAANWWFYTEMVEIVGRPKHKLTGIFA